MPVSDAVKKSSDGTIIELEVTPGSRTIKVPSGYNPWRKRIEVRLTEAAQKGKANQQLMGELSKVLGLSSSDITLVSGHTSHKKTVHIKGVGMEVIVDLLQSLIEKE